MFEALLDTRSKPVAVQVKIRTKRPCRVNVLLFDKNLKGAVHTNRWCDVDGSKTLEIRMPRSPEISVLRVYCKDDPKANVIIVDSIKPVKLNQYLPCLDKNGEMMKIREFVRFAQEFSEMAGVLPPSTYYSENNNFRIDYLPTIPGSGTPARIHNKTGRMEVAQRVFTGMTVPNRMAVLAHEFSHFNLNDVQSDEIEADLNGLKIYLGLGYPNIEASNTFTGVFKRNDTPENRARYEAIIDFIKRFDKEKYSMCLT